MNEERREFDLLQKTSGLRCRVCGPKRIRVKSIDHIIPVSLQLRKTLLNLGSVDLETASRQA